MDKEDGDDDIFVELSNAVTSSDQVIENVEDDEVEANDDGNGKGKRKKTSLVWKHFKEISTINGVERSQCSHCKTVLISTSTNGTGSMKRHLTKCLPKYNKDIRQMLMTKNKGTLALTANRFDPDRFRELLTSAIIMHDLPFSFVQYEGIKATYEYLHPEIKMVSRNTLKADVLKMFSKERVRIKNFLQTCPGRICFTSDLWMSIVTDGYLTLTAHVIDNDWVLQKRILSFCYMPPPYTRVALAEKLYALLCDWGIESKVLSITLDNASANDVCVDLLRGQLNQKHSLISNGMFFHIRCCAHVLNLVVQEGLKDIDEVVKKARESVKYVRGSQIRKKKFLECVSLVGLDCKRGLRQDVPTRWNSTFLMLDSVTYYKRAFCHLQLSDSNYKTCPTFEEWEKLEKLNEFLAPFYNITCIFSGVKYPTANLYFPIVYTCYFNLKTFVSGEDLYMSTMASAMMMKFEKYWKDFCLVLSIAITLDPRYKLNFVDYAYCKIYGKRGSEQFYDVKKKLEELFLEYSNGATSCVTNVQSKKNTTPLLWHKSIMKVFL